VKDFWGLVMPQRGRRKKITEKEKIVNEQKEITRLLRGV
jgi:hypothetical protein